MKASHGEMQDRERAVEAGERLDGDVGDPEQDAGGGAEHDPVVVVRGAHARAGDQQRADREHAALEAEHAGERVGRVRAGLGGERDDEQQQAERGHARRRPTGGVPTSKPKMRSARTASITTPVREHGLDDRQRGEGERGDVEQPGAGGDAHADREPLGREQRTGRSAADAGCRPWEQRSRPGACRGSPAAWRRRRPAPAECPVRKSRCIQDPSWKARRLRPGHSCHRTPSPPA